MFDWDELFNSMEELSYMLQEAYNQDYHVHDPVKTLSLLQQLKEELGK